MVEDRDIVNYNVRLVCGLSSGAISNDLSDPYPRIQGNDILNVKQLQK